MPSSPEPTGGLQLELNFEPRTEPCSPSGTMKPEELAQISEMMGTVVNLIGEVVGDAVRDGVERLFERVEQRHALEQEKLAQTFEAALERQEVRFREALERQAEICAAAIARQAELHAEQLRAALAAAQEREGTASSVTVSTAKSVAAEVADLRKMLCLGFDDVRTTLQSFQHELRELVDAESHLRRVPSATTPQSAKTPLPLATPPPMHERRMAQGS